MPTESPRQAMMDVAVNGFELRRGEDGLTLRFSFEVEFAPDIATWLAAAFGTDVFLRCENAQPALPGLGAGEPKAHARAQGVRRKQRTVTLAGADPRAYVGGGRHQGRAATDYVCPECLAGINLQCRSEHGRARGVHDMRKAPARAVRRHPKPQQRRAPMPDAMAIAESVRVGDWLSVPPMRGGCGARAVVEVAYAVDEDRVGLLCRDRPGCRVWRADMLALALARGLAWRVPAGATCRCPHCRGTGRLSVLEGAQ